MMPLIGARTSSLPTRSFSLLMDCPTFGQIRRDLRALLRQRLLVLRIELRLHGLNAVQRFNNEIVTPIIVARSRVKHILQRLSADQCGQPEDGEQDKRDENDVTAHERDKRKENKDKRQVEQKQP